ncbi:RING finger protein vilya [Drosophila elegans]|uniref:RING finger protein vilya n=1 Tax=Drosophila elegans TaxID=30023 RepID=UPI0007E73E82|nr:RING finger protein vilya [Drosophila elegans]
MFKTRPVCEVKDDQEDTSASTSNAPQIGETEAHKLWIHCNSCCELFCKKKFIFFLLACHHVSCERCVKVAAGRTPSDASIYTCPVCKRSVRGRQVNNAMPTNFKNFFHPEPYALTNDFLETFQRANHRHLDKHKEKKENEMDKVLKDIELVKSVCQKRYLEYQMLRVERKRMTERTRQLKVQLANEKAERQRIAQAKINRVVTSQKPTSSTPDRANSQTSQKRRSSKELTRSTLVKRKKVTSFSHQPNNSFNL